MRPHPKSQPCSMECWLFERAEKGGQEQLRMRAQKDKHPDMRRAGLAGEKAFMELLLLGAGLGAPYTKGGRLMASSEASSLPEEWTWL